MRGNTVLHSKLTMCRFKIIEYPIEGLSISKLNQEFYQPINGSVLFKRISIFQGMQIFLKPQWLQKSFLASGLNLCRGILLNTPLLHGINEEHYDAVLMVDSFLSYCLHLIPQRFRFLMRRWESTSRRGICIFQYYRHTSSDRKSSLRL